MDVKSDTSIEDHPMSRSCPNLLQIALLYDSANAIDIRALQAAFLKSELNVPGYKYNVVEADGRTNFRCFGGQASNVMVFVEWLDRPAVRANLNTALSSVFNQITVPDAATLIGRHRGVLLINVHHGAMSQSREVQTLLAQMGVGQAGQSLPQYQERLRVMGLLAAMATEISKPTLSHWTHTDALAKPQAIKNFMCDASPNPLHVHPLPFRGPGTTQDQGIAGLVTFGAAAFIGREIRVRPTQVPWSEAYQHALGFITLAIRKTATSFQMEIRSVTTEKAFATAFITRPNPWPMRARKFPVTSWSRCSTTNTVFDRPTMLRRTEPWTSTSRNPNMSSSRAGPAGKSSPSGKPSARWPSGPAVLL